MALFRIPLIANKQIRFWKLMGSGKNGTFDIHPDLNQWALLYVSSKPDVLPLFIHHYWRFFNCSITKIELEPLEGHGFWDKKEVFGKLPKSSNYDGAVCVLTRATIRLKRLRNFWRNVSGAAHDLNHAEGFITSYGIGEIPWIKQATVSLWESKQSMKNYAYKMQHHREVIQKTRQENWYKEEMFVRFRIISISGLNAEAKNVTLHT